MPAKQDSGIVEWGRMIGKAAIKTIKYAAIAAVVLIGADVLWHAFAGDYTSAFPGRDHTLTSSDTPDHKELWHQAEYKQAPKTFTEELNTNKGYLDYQQHNTNPIGEMLKWCGNLLQKIPGVDFGIEEVGGKLVINEVHDPKIVDAIQAVDGAVGASVDFVKDNPLKITAAATAVGVGAYALTRGDNQPAQRPIGQFTAAEIQRRQLARQQAALANGQTQKG